MNGKHQTIAIYAEIISSIAVVITLIVLIIEVRGNTEIARLETYKGDLDRAIAWRENSITSNPLNAKIYTDFANGIYPDEENQKVEASTLNAILFNLYNTFESTFYSNEYGVLGEGEWERMSRVMCREYRYVKESPVHTERVNTRVSLAFSEFLADECN